MSKERYLHSNMVRFIIQAIALFEVYLCYIYIPIWLDLLLETEIQAGIPNIKFTFQYG